MKISDSVGSDFVDNDYFNVELRNKELMNTYYIVRYTAKYNLDHSCVEPYYQKTHPKRCKDLDEVNVFIEELKSGKFPTFHKGFWSKWTGVKLVSYEVFKVTEEKIKLNNQDVDLVPVKAITKYNQDKQKIHIRNNLTGGCLCGANPKEFEVIDYDKCHGLMYYVKRTDPVTQFCKRCVNKLEKIL